MLEANGVSKRYGDTVALDNVSVKPVRGQTTVLIGPSGCGKSTLLRTFIGLIHPDSGDIKFDGEVLTRRNELHFRRKVGYVIQSGGLFPHLTAKHNVTLAAEQHDYGDIEGRLKELRQLVHLEESVLERFPGELSGGQRQRVSLMRALMMDPPLLLLDEPLGALDPMVRAELQRELREIFQRLKKTVVMVTHDLAEAAYFGDLIVLMRDGNIEQRGSFDELQNEPASDFVTAFVNAQKELHSTEARE